MSSRHRSRELALQLSYQWDLDPTSLQDPKVLDRFWRNQSEASDDTRPYFEILVKGVASHLPEIDAQIELLLKNWKFSRVGKVDLAILRVAVYEMLFHTEADGQKIPNAIIIDEAIELGKRFGNQETPSFINGLLDALAKKGGSGGL